jgi:2-haloalkanoic acid dehalogenase type II
MKQIQVVLFDLGGTLIYFDSDWSKVLREAGRAMAHNLCDQGYEVDEEGFTESFTIRMEGYRMERDQDGEEDTTAAILSQALTQAGHPETPDTAIRAALRTFYAVTQLHWRVEADTISTLQTLQAAGYRLGILSNAADDEDVRQLVHLTGIEPYMEHIFTSARVGLRKPHSRMFEVALQAFGVNAAHAAMVGDKLSADVRGAQAVGMFAVWVNRRAEPAECNLLGEITPDAVADTLSELPNLLP